MGKKLFKRGKINGLPVRTRTQNYHRKGLWAMKQRGPVPGVLKKRRTPGRPKTVITKPFGKETRVVVRPRAPRVYPPDPIKHKAHHRRTAGNPPKVRSSLSPGTVVIVLSGRCRGRRVVLLKVLSSGLLLVTGPYKANGIPLRRINPAYVIATSTKIDISSVKLPKKLNDDFFKKPELKKRKKGSASDFLGKKVEETTESKEPKETEPKEEKSEQKKSKKSKKEKEEKKEDTKPEKKRKSKKKTFKKNKIAHKRLVYQKMVDEQVIPIIKKEPYMFAYLNSLFSLQQGEYPHNIRF